jgi:hypothetical protein
MADYSKGKIHKIFGSGLVYYGSTTQTLSERLHIHKNDLKRGRGCSVKQIIEGGEYQIELCEDYPCNSRKELLWRERFYFDNNECINQKAPIVSVLEVSA